MAGRPTTMLLGQKCSRGHKLTVDTLYVSPKGQRACRVCKKADAKASKAKRETTHTRARVEPGGDLTSARGSEEAGGDDPSVVTPEDYAQVREWIRTGYVKDLLKNRIGLSWREFASWVGLPHASVARWIRGDTAFPAFNDNKSLPMVYLLQWLDDLAEVDDEFMRRCGYPLGVVGGRMHAKDVETGRHVCPT